MNCIIKEVSIDYIKEHLSYLFYEDTRYFALIKNRKFVGIYGITDYGNNIGEAFLTIFVQFRLKVFSREFFKILFEHPFTLGYEEIWTWLNWKSWAKIFNRFKTDGIEEQFTPPFWDQNPHRIWFRKKG